MACIEFIKFAPQPKNFIDKLSTGIVALNCLPELNLIRLCWSQVKGLKHDIQGFQDNWACIMKEEYWLCERESRRYTTGLPTVHKKTI